MDKLLSAVRGMLLSVVIEVGPDSTPSGYVRVPLGQIVAVCQATPKHKVAFGQSPGVREIDGLLMYSSDWL